jgi:hypothetical protein
LGTQLDCAKPSPAAFKIRLSVTVNFSAKLLKQIEEFIFGNVSFCGTWMIRKAGLRDSRTVTLQLNLLGESRTG